MFQSSPGLLAGATWPTPLRSARQSWFQSSPGLLAGRYVTTTSSGTGGDCFNPRPAFWPGATVLMEAIGTVLQFQSSPGLLAGRDSAGRHAVTRGRHCFNPRPAFWPGATINWGVFRPIFLVSILARPFGRALPGDLHSRRRAHGRFQSSPGLLAGATRAGAGGRGGAITVSILARPFGRALRSMSTILPSTRCMFQSSPGLLARRYPQRCVMMLSTIWFQSSPGLLAGRDGMLATTDLEQFQFQSSPGLLAGRYFQGPWGLPFTPSFNPRPAFWPGATDQHRGPDRPHQVSILARPFGRA